MTFNEHIRRGYILLHGSPRRLATYPKAKPKIRVITRPKVPIVPPVGMWQAPVLNDPTHPEAITQLISNLQQQNDRHAVASDIELEHALFLLNGTGVARSHTRAQRHVYYAMHPITGTWSVFDLPSDSFDVDAVFTIQNNSIAITSSDGVTHLSRDGVTWYQILKPQSETECRLMTPQETRYALYRFATGGYVQAKQCTRTGELTSTHFMRHDPAGRACSYFERVTFSHTKDSAKDAEGVHRPHLTVRTTAGYLGATVATFP